MKAYPIPEYRSPELRRIEGTSIVVSYAVEGETESDALANLAVLFRGWGVVNLEACDASVISGGEDGMWEVEVTIPLGSSAIREK